jgi:hypothetical protein
MRSQIGCSNHERVLACRGGLRSLRYGGITETDRSLLRRAPSTNYRFWSFPI